MVNNHRRFDSLIWVGILALLTTLGCVKAGPAPQGAPTEVPDSVETESGDDSIPVPASKSDAKEPTDTINNSAPDATPANASPTEPKKD